jgi:hypothetical protein
MGSTARAAVDAPGVGVGERWQVRGRSGAIFLVGGRQIGGFVYGGKIARATAVERALIAAQAPLMYEALLDLISTAREDGALVHEDGRPDKGHRPGCGCGMCSAVLALALAEGGGRCILCGCTQDDACVGGFGEGCAWVPGTREFLCTAHPADVIAAAKRFLAGGARARDPEHVSKPVKRVLSQLARRVHR